MNDFKNRLDEIVPDPPDTSEWSHRALLGAVRRRRRRNTWTGAATAVVVVVALTFGFVHFITRPMGTALIGGPGQATPASGATPTASQMTECPTDQKAYLDADQAVTLPAGAVSLRWCTWSEPDGSLSEWAPPEPLTTWVGVWIDTFNALRPATRDQACTADWSIPALALLTYPDGGTRTVAGMAAGCGTIGGRVGFGEARAKMIDLYGVQRGADDAPRPAAFTPCTANSSTIAGRLSNVTTIAICAAGHTASPAKLVRSDLVPVVRDEIAQQMTDYSGQPNPDGAWMKLYQANGEFFTMIFDSTQSAWLWQDGDDWKIWRPSAQAEQAIAAAVEAPAKPTSSAKNTVSPTPKAGVTTALGQDVCQTSITASSGVEPLPKDAVKVWMCSSFRYAPPDPLTGARAAEFAETTHGSIEPCVAQRGEESFIAEYADGRRVRLMIPAADCMEQVSAMQAFPRLLAEQRAEQQTVTAPVQNLEKLCAMGDIENVVPMKPGEADEVRHCYFTIGTQESRHAQGIAYAADQQKLLLDDLVANSVKVESSVPTMPVMLVLLQTNGERIWVRYVDSSKPILYWQSTEDEGVSYTWTPTPEVQQIIQQMTKGE